MGGARERRGITHHRLPVAGELWRHSGGLDTRESLAPGNLQISSREYSLWDKLTPEDHHPEDFRNLDVRQFLLSGSFELPLASDPRQNPASRWTTWGKSSISRFGGGDGDLSMDGDVITMTFGIDREWNRWIVGVALSRSAGDGSLRMDKVHWGGGTLKAQS